MTKLNEAWLNIGETLAKGIYGSIDAISKSLAEAIILGKDLGQAFKQFVQNAIVNALSALISFVLQKLFLYALEKKNIIPFEYDAQSIENIIKKRLYIQRKITPYY